MSAEQNTVQGLYFDAGETSPRLITVSLETKYVEELFTGDQVEVIMPILPPLLGPGGPSTFDALSIDTMGFGGPPLEQPFKLFIRDNFMNDGSPRNFIPSRLTNGTAPHPWAGNLLALKEIEPRAERWTDCCMEDVATLTRYFEWYGNREIRQQGLAQLRAMFPDAIIVSLSGDE